MLSYSFNTGITTGYVKGTSSSDINESLEHLKACGPEVGHPMLLPIIILSHDLAETSDIRQRSARDWLRRLENAITMRDEIDQHEVYTDFDVDGINRDLVECHSQVLWKRPQAYQEIVREIKAASERFRQRVDDDRLPPAVRKLHGSMLARLDFYRVKLTGMEHYAHTTLERLHIQRQAVSHTVSSPLRSPPLFRIRVTDDDGASFTTSWPRRSRSSTWRWLPSRGGWRMQASATAPP